MITKVHRFNILEYLLTYFISEIMRNIGHRYFFDMSTILRSAHIIPTGTTGLYYVNNYIDWDYYNTIFDPEFLANGIRDADRIAMEN
jgi:hypothetical protein